jgi:2,3-dimethylmalate lyase
VNEHQKRLRFREILEGDQGVLAPSVPEPLLARLTQDCGFQLVHIAGNGMHRTMFLPDEGMVTMTEMADRGRVVSEVLDIPLLLDAETGYGGSGQTARAVRLWERAGVAGMRLEDGLEGQSGINRTGESGITPVDLMCDKIKAAVDARTDEAFVLTIRCDGRLSETLEQVHDRCEQYRQAGADAVGLGPGTRDDIIWFGQHMRGPLIVGWTRGSGVTNAHDLFGFGYRVALMPSNVHLAALAGAREFLLELARTGSFEHLASMTGMGDVLRWYSDVGFRTPKPFA